MEVVVDLFRLENQRDGELRLLAIVDAGALHPDDGVWGAIQPQGGTDDVWIGAEPDPQFVGNDNDVIAAGYALFRQKVAAHEKRLAYHLEHAVRPLVPADVLRIVFGGQVEAGAGPGAKILEDSVLLLPVEEVACGNAIVIGLDFGPDHYELIGLRIRQRSQKRCIIDREDGGIGAYADGQREQNSEGQAAIAGQHTEAEPDVLKKSLHSDLP